MQNLTPKFIILKLFKLSMLLSINVLSYCSAFDFIYLFVAAILLFCFMVALIEFIPRTIAIFYLLMKNISCVTYDLL